MNKSYITEIGIAEPEYAYRQEDLAAYMSDFLELNTQETSKLYALYLRSGIAMRRCVLPDFEKKEKKPRLFKKGTIPSVQDRMMVYKELALPLALQACHLLHTPTAQVTHLITVSCTGMYAPGLDIALAKALDLAPSVYRTSINFMGCYAALHALKQADHICKCTPTAKVLIVCVELCSLHFQSTNTTENWVSNMLFADGAAAVMVQSTDALPKTSFAIEGFNSMLLHNPRETMAWEISSEGFLMQLSSYVPALLEDALPSLKSIPTDDLDIMICHPGGKKIILATQLAFSLSDACIAHSMQVLKSRGNMSSPSVLYILHDIWKQSENLANEATLGMIAYGPGLTVEQATLTYQNGKQMAAVTQIEKNLERSL